MIRKPACRHCHHSEGSHYTGECCGSIYCGCKNYDSDFYCRICNDNHYEHIFEVNGINFYRCANCSVVFCYPDSMTRG